MQQLGHWPGRPIWAGHSRWAPIFLQTLEVHNCWTNWSHLKFNGPVLTHRWATAWSLAHRTNTSHIAKTDYPSMIAYTQWKKSLIDIQPKSRVVLPQSPFEELAVFCICHFLLLIILAGTVIIKDNDMWDVFLCCMDTIHNIHMADKCYFFQKLVAITAQEVWWVWILFSGLGWI